MKQEFLNLEITTNGQKLYELTDKIYNWIKVNNLELLFLGLNESLHPKFYLH